MEETIVSVIEYLLCVVQAALECRIKELNQMRTLGKFHVVEVVLPFIVRDYNLPSIAEYVLRGDVAFSSPVDALEGGVGLKRLALAECLSGEFNLHLGLARVDHQLGESLLSND